MRKNFLRVSPPSMNSPPALAPIRAEQKIVQINVCIRKPGTSVRAHIQTCVAVVNIYCPFRSFVRSFLLHFCRQCERAQNSPYSETTTLDTVLPVVSSLFIQQSPYIGVWVKKLNTSCILLILILCPAANIVFCLVYLVHR